MGLVLLNLQSNQFIQLNNDNPVIIGRKNLKECNDKRVSRSHVKITCLEDGKIRLTALHTNPCFFTKNGKPPVLQVDKDEEETLSEGDCLGLLPDAFWFQVTAKNNCKFTESEFASTSNEYTTENINEIVHNLNESTQENNSEAINEKVPNKAEDNFKVQKENEVFGLTVPICSANTASNLEESLACNASKSKNGTSDKPNCLGSLEFEKTKRLPVWRYLLDDQKETFFTSNEEVDVATTSGKTHVTKKAKIQPDSSTSINSNTSCNLPINPKDIKKEKDSEEANFVSHNLEIKDSLPSEIAAGSGLVLTNDSEKFEELQSKTESGKCNNDASKIKRPLCQYEDHCYRKNPKHKLVFSHPGDPDYVEYENRPTCSYGALCYRKNQNHRIEFKHPSDISKNECSPASSPVPRKRKRKAVQCLNIKDDNNSNDNGYDNDDDDDNDYDVEDPFGNDASSDEYIPSSEDEAD